MTHNQTPKLTEHADTDNVIIISGCSWSIGEWQRGDLCNGEPSNDILHGGVSQYINENLNRTVINLGIPAGSNLQVANKIKGWLERNPNKTIEKIIIFQTDYVRDVPMIFHEDYDNYRTSAEFASLLISRFYSRLSEISSLANCSIYLVGGLSDIPQFDNIEQYYPGLIIACHSLTNLVIYNNPIAETPVLSVYPKQVVGFIEKLKSKLSTDEIENLINEINLGIDRESKFFENPEYFWPDGRHPNRVAHKKLYDFLIEQKIL